MPNLETQNSQDNCVEGGSLVIAIMLTPLFCKGEQPSQWKMAKYGVSENPCTDWHKVWQCVITLGFLFL